MDKSAAVKIIKDAFERAFDKGQFFNFSKNLVNYLDTTKPFTYQGNIIPDAYERSIQSLERIGKYEDSEDNKIDVLIVRLRKEYSLERARTMQRNFVAWYLNGSRGGELKDAALVAFVSPDDRDWRFSLVRMDYNLAESPSGKIKVETELTPARRYSFLVGENESSHTAQVQLLPILENDKTNPLLSDLEKAFSIEVVTREFFNKYRELFHNVEEALQGIVRKDERVKADFAAKDVETVNFSKKLLGQIVFLYFLQKKGWFGVGRDEDWGTGPKNFLRLLFNKEVGSYQNFFNDVLEPLFYEALAFERADDFYSRFNCKIPFLNGGLFDPINNYDWVHTDILLSNQLFSNSQKTKEGDVGTGILDVFDRYNFTVKEDEPLDKEVAIDPEMLGQVFENLLEVKDRKSKGTYYTPREIVHYMCQESLINYLDTAINTGDVPLVRTPPPQGKFFGAADPVQEAMKTSGYRALVPHEDIEALIRYGDLTSENDIAALKKQKDIQQGIIKESIYKLILKPSIKENAKLIDDKLKNIRVCDPAIGSGAFPVGLMTEIVRARNTLTKYLSDEKVRTNYHFKRHAIQNCLYGVDIDPGAVEIAKLRLWLSLVVDEDDIKQIQPLPNLDYKIVCGNSLLGVEKTLFNLELFKELERLKPLYFNETNAKKKQAYKGDIDNLINQITNNNQNFDFEVYFSEVFHEKGGFDVVIANPPYVQTSREKGKAYSNYKTYKVGDTYAYFYEKSILHLLNKVGTIAFISSSLFIKGIRYEPLRRLIESELHLIDLRLQGDNVFEKVLLPTCTLIACKGKPIRTWSFKDSIPNIRMTEKIKEGADKLFSFTRIMRGFEIGKDKVLDSGDYRIITGSCVSKWAYNKTRFIDRKTFHNFRKDDYFFSGERILIRETGSFLTCLYVNEDNLYSNRSLYSIKIRRGDISYKYLLALLNSTLLQFYYSTQFRSETDIFPKIRIVQVKLLPIKVISLDKQKCVIDIVDKILSVTKDEDYLSNPAKQARVKELERQIDQMVYELYGLTPEEIRVVEGVGRK